MSNSSKTCQCQGENNEGASFTFGCSWKNFYKTCKFGFGNPSNHKDKFKMSKIATKADKMEVEQYVHLLADTISPMYKEIAPTSYQNMTGMCSEHF